MQEVDANIAALERALASGSETVRMDGRTRIFRSVDEIIKAIGYWKKRRAELSGNTKSMRPSVARFQ